MNERRFRQLNMIQTKNDILAGMVVGLALIPEAIGFSIIAGVSPMVGLYASFCIALVISLVGGRTGMISAATGSTALLMVNLVAEHGLKYLLAATILTGIIQIFLGIVKLARLLKFVPRSVMTGFVNALAILIFMAQLTYFTGESWQMYAMVAGALLIIYLFPYITKAVPSPLVAIIVITVIAVTTGSQVKTIGDIGTISGSLPDFALPNIPLNWETLKIIFPYSISIAFVGLLETFLTARIVDDMTDTPSNKNKEARGQGIANIVSGFFGGMAGCAMIGQSVINIKSGGRRRLSTFVAGLFLMVLIIILNRFLVEVPMAALVGVMVMVSIGTFDWSSLMKLHRMPKTDAAVMIVTVVTVVLTSNLSIGVLVGIIMSAIFFAAKISKVHVETVLDELHDKRIYHIRGQVFFVSIEGLLSHFDYNEDVKQVDIDLTHAHLWDDSAIGAIDTIAEKFAQKDVEVKVVGANADSHKLIERLSTHHQTKKKISIL